MFYSILRLQLLFKEPKVLELLRDSLHRTPFNQLSQLASTDLDKECNFMSKNYYFFLLKSLHVIIKRLKGTSYAINKHTSNSG